MGLHHQANHGRVFRGLDAKNHLDIAKRDSHGSHIRLNVPGHMKAAVRPADPAQTNYVNKAVVTSEDVETYTSVVYMTLSQDFSGEVAGYTTLSSEETSTPAVASSTPSATPTNSDEAAYAAQKSAATARGGSSGASTTITSTASVIPTSSAAADDGSNNKSMFLNAPAAAAATTAAAVGGTPLQQSHGATAAAGTPISATRAPIAQDGHAMSTGAKAGLAIGILITLALAAGLVFFCWRRRRNTAAHQELAGEKRVSNSSSLFGGNAMSEKHASVASERSTHTTTTAPRLSLRPVTQFLPMLAGSDNRKSTGNHLDVANAAMSEKPKSMWERRSQNSQNPFEDANVISEKQAGLESPPTNPFDEPEADSENAKSAHSQKPSMGGQDGLASVDTAAAVPVAAAGNATTARGPNNVHRVQLDFKPSMEDELELKSGQLVRMLHEYDDGWALCIRMDRTQQGVVPRTCLSKLPVKPRPQGPPSQGPNGRPMSPMGPPGMAPRPLTPTSRERSDSNAAIERPSTPTGVVPTRKPVPGQAI